MAGNADDAQDLLQDALLEAYGSFRKFQRGTYFDKWLYRIMTHTFIDRQRLRKRFGLFLSLDDPAGAEDSSPPFEIFRTGRAIRPDSFSRACSRSRCKRRSMRYPQSSV